MGRPEAVKPHGTEIAGMPDMSAGIVRTSFKYIEIGSAFSPCLNGTFGVVGATIRSTRAKAASKSRRTSVRTFCACP